MQMRSSGASSRVLPLACCNVVVVCREVADAVSALHERLPPLKLLHQHDGVAENVPVAIVTSHPATAVRIEPATHVPL